MFVGHILEAFLRSSRLDLGSSLAHSPGDVNPDRANFAVMIAAVQVRSRLVQLAVRKP
jgi:hypothetical protein